MKKGAENRKKTIMAGALGAGGLIAAIFIYTQLFSDSAPAPTAPPVIQSAPTITTAKQTATPPPAANSTTSSSTPRSSEGAAVAPGIDATKLASTSTGLDPTLDETAMHRTESLIYSGSGRNIFSSTYTAPPPPLPKNVPNPRTVVVPPPVQQGPPPIPPPPPINLKFFGTAKRGTTGKLQAFLLSGDDVYLANEGDIVVRKYKIESITTNSIRVTDLQNVNTQTLPLQQ